MSGTTFKVYCGPECRRFKHTGETGPTVAWLQERLHVPAGSSARLSWKDEDGDTITIVDDSDLAEAVLAQRAGPVRLVMSEHDSIPPATPTSPTTSMVRPAGQPEATMQVEPQPQPQQQKPGVPAPEHAPVSEPEVGQTAAPTPTAVPNAPAVEQQAQSEFETKIAALMEKVAGAVKESGLFPEQVLETTSVEPDLLRGAAGHLPFLQLPFLQLPFLQQQQQHYPGSGSGRRRGCGGRVHHHVICDHSGMNPIVGTRFHKMGEDFDLCEEEFAKLSEDDKVQYEVIERRGAQPVPFAQWKTSKKGGAKKCGVKKCGTKKGGTKKGGCRKTSQPQGPYYAWAANAAVAEGDVLPMATLETGRFGPGVEQLQRFLIKHDLMNEGAIRWRAGLYGPRTAHALHEFQARNNLNGATPGVFDEMTRTALLKHVSQPAPPQGLSGAEPPAAHPATNREDDRYEVVYEEPPPASEQTPRAQAPAATAPVPETVTATVAASAAESRWAHELSILESMGFAKSDDLVQQLDKAQGSINIVISHLLQ